MPSVAENRQMFSQTWDWRTCGDEWSAPWGGTEPLWRHALLPRIQRFVPAETILEIAPGFGRCTQYLKDLCSRLLLVDLSAPCIEACQARFSACSHLSYYVNDGYSLDMIPDASVDFVFSFDSLVHAEADVLEAYLRQLAMKLKPDGAGFLHHSNVGAYPLAAALSRAIPSARLQRLVGQSGLLVDLTHWRAATMTARRFQQYCDRAGLCCSGQEMINWGGGPYLIDCFSWFTLGGSTPVGAKQVLRNRSFWPSAR